MCVVRTPRCSGRVSFKEFILGMEKLVLSELEEEEEEAQAQQGEQSKVRRRQAGTGRMP